MQRDNLIGKRFGRLTVIDFAGLDKCGHAQWLCECDCGNRVVKLGTNLKRGLTTSCGCRRTEVTRECKTTHGMCGARLYTTWRNMIRRCEDPNDKLYHRYGGRGIHVCNEWYNFENFLDWALNSGYEPDLTIDRMDNDEDYCPKNCRWANRITQGNNTSTNRHITYNGETHTIAEWARLLGITYNSLYHRIEREDFRDFELYFGLFRADYR